MLDSGSANHICSQKSHFTDYQPVKDRTVSMGNGYRCKVRGVGSVRIKTQDGVIRTLSNVHHVPDLKQNIISLGTLDSRGYNISAQGGVLKVSKGAHDILKAIKHRNLYVVQGTSIVASTYSSSTRQQHPYGMGSSKSLFYSKPKFRSGLARDMFI